MPVTRRHFSNLTQDATVSTSVDTSIQVWTLSAAWVNPPTVPFTAAAEPDTSSEEIVEVTAVSGTSVTVTRGIDGSSPRSHTGPFTLSHRTSARDYDDPNVHILATKGVHGIPTGASFVGTTGVQTLSGKTLDNTCDVSGTPGLFSWPDLQIWDPGTGVTGSGSASVNTAFGRFVKTPNAVLFTWQGDVITDGAFVGGIFLQLPAALNVWTTAVEVNLPGANSTIPGVRGYAQGTKVYIAPIPASTTWSGLIVSGTALYG